MFWNDPEMHGSTCTCAYCEHYGINGHADDEEVAEVEGTQYECASCGNKKSIEDYQKRTVAWCDSDDCGCIRNFKRK